MRGGQQENQLDELGEGVSSQEERKTGVKNIELFYLAMLCKWRWKLKTEPNSIWREIIEIRYGH